jgi:uncharacterized membrane protein YjgN (DUF898 family)
MLVTAAETSAASAASVAPTSAPLRRLSLRFTGAGAEYFRIWIVNLALSFLTLGVYSAWAKVRTQQYFYRHTWLEGSSFEYLADPRQILKGRSLLVLLLALAFALQAVFPLASVPLVLLLAVLTPWAVVLSMGFRARNSAYRNVTFGFSCSLGHAYRVYMLGYWMLLLTCGFFHPTVRWQRAQLVVESTRYGSEPLRWNTSSESYYGCYVKTLLLGLPAVLLSIWPPSFGLGTPVWGRWFASALFLVPTVYMRARFENLLYGGIVLGPHSLSSRQELMPLLGIYATNSVAVLATLGLAIPWAKVRLARYRIERLMLHARGELDVQADSGASIHGGYGDAAVDLGGVDLGL